jgi:hypothetical protein
MGGGEGDQELREYSPGTTEGRDVDDPGKGGGLGNRGDDNPNATGGGVDGCDVGHNPG